MEKHCAISNESDENCIAHELFDERDGENFCTKINVIAHNSRT